MTVRDRILERPAAAQVVIKAYITKESLDDSTPDFEHYGLRALDWWASVVREFGDLMDESAIAKEVVGRLRNQEVWGKILRESTQ